MMSHRFIAYFTIALLTLGSSCREKTEEVRQSEAGPIHVAFPESQREIELIMKDITNNIVKGDEENGSRVMYTDLNLHRSGMGLSLRT